MKRIVLILMGLTLAYIVNAQLTTFEGYRHYLLEDDTINITRSSNVFKISVYVDDASTDSCDIIGKVDTLDDIATDTIVLAPGLNYCVGNLWNRRLDTLSIISRSGCKAWITTLER